MPTVLAMNNYFYRRGGAEAVFLEHMAALEQVGWRVVPFAMQHPENRTSEWSSFFPQELEYGRRYGLLRSIKNSGRVIYSLDARSKLLRLIEKAQPDIAHVHNIYHHLSPSVLWVLKKAGIPVVMTVHDLKIACPAYTMFSHGEVCERCRGGRLRHVAFRRCIKNSVPLSTLVWSESTLHRMLGTWHRCVDLFIANSQFYVNKLVEWGFDRDRFVYLPNCIPDGALSDAVTDPGEGFMYFGRLASGKGLGTLIRAAARSGCRVTVAGSGPEETRLRALAQRLDAPVSFVGFLDEAGVRKYLNKVRAAVLMSDWYENAPKSVLEAYAGGRPVIVSDRGGNPECVQVGETGFVVPAGDVERLSETMQRMGDMPRAQVTAMGDAARRWVTTRFSQARHLQGVLDVYARLGVG